MGKDWNTVTILGVGLIGGSIGQAIKKRRPDAHVVGWGQRSAGLEQACELGAIDRFELDLHRAVAGADVVMVCTPVDQIANLVIRLSPACQPGAIVTDAGSTKAGICQRLAQECPALAFVGSHPIAGKAVSGVAHADADLFTGKLAVVVDTPAQQRAQEVVMEFWRLLGSRVVTMSADKHDEILARTSHLPHVLAALLAGGTAEEQLPFCGTGFRDTTRIASGDAGIWLPILLENRPAILEALLEFRGELESFTQALLTRDEMVLTRFLQRGMARRNQL
jgi:cyclohexadieny/prephenate dehydrogenase